MGDFNAVSNPRVDRRNEMHTNSFTPSEEPEISFFRTLTDWELIDLHYLWEPDNTSHTWKNKRSSSRIDYIWGSKEIAHNLLKCRNDNIVEITNSDHTLITIHLPRNLLFRSPPKHDKHSKVKYEKTINIDKTTTAQWDKFSQKVDKKLMAKLIEDKVLNTQLNTDNGREISHIIQNTWEDFESILIAAAFNHLYNEKKTTRGVRHNKKSRQNRIENHILQTYRKTLKIIQTWTHITSSDILPSKLRSIWSTLNQASKIIGPFLPETTNRQQFQDVIISGNNHQLLEHIKKALPALKEACYREEKRRIDKEIREAIQNRCSNLKTNQSKIVRTLTNNFREKIVIDRIRAMDKEGREYIAIDQDEIHHQTELYYQSAFRKRNNNFDILDQKWKEQYDPKANIDEAWYKELDSEISPQELNEILQDLPNNKAAGPSKIKYEMLKHLGNTGRKTLLALFNLYLKTGMVPAAWKKSLLYPISKGKDWQGNLSNTRPIVLLDVTRKCFTKIITNRLSSICKKHKILKGPNFAGLPGESTSEPIHLLNNICEEAREEKKELWILFQDTAKAYDTISLDMLKKALIRIRLPSKIIQLILEPFTNRSMQVITDSGLSKEIIAGDGIDQGETISPLLWRIFYDPLLCEIQNIPETGYTMACNWTKDLSKGNHIDKEKLSLRQAAIAYMDDTTWIARSEEDMNKILNRANLFYTANDSQINGSKSILITINSQNTMPNKIKIGANLEEVTELDRNACTRFLGIWIGNKNHTKDATLRSQHEISAIIPLLRRKKITDKLVEYIINRVLIPRIEYRIQHCSLDRRTCNRLTTQLRKVLKSTAGIAITMPNSVIHHKKIYNIKSIWEIQLENQITNMFNRLNDNGPAGLSTIIRLKQAQIRYWEPSNILQDKVPATVLSKGNFSIQIIKMANKLGIAILSSTWSEYFNWQGGSLSVKTCLNNSPQYQKASHSLKKYNLMFIDQLIDTDSKCIIDWKIIKLMSGQSKGPPPVWYQTIKNLLTNEYGSLTNNWQKWNWTIQSRKFFSKSSQEDNRRWKWFAWIDMNEPSKTIWSRCKGHPLTTFSNPEFYQIQAGHTPGTTEFIRSNNSTNQQQNDPSEHQICPVKNTVLSFDLVNNNPKYRKCKMLELPLETYTLDSQTRKELEYATYDNIGNERITGVEIEDHGTQIIQEYVRSQEHIQHLQKEYSANVHNHLQQTFCFYTDGSMGKSKDQSIRMGAAWIQVTGPNPGSFFTSGVDNWPSALRAELTAIVLVLLVVPNKCSIEIRTDSASCISIYNTLSRPHPKNSIKKMMKIPNWQLWMRLLDLITRKEISLQLTKVKAHSNDKWNKEVDKLAKQAKEEPELVWEDCLQPKALTTASWNGIPIDISLRTFIKDIQKREILVKWAYQNRIQQSWQKEIVDQSEFDWKGVWEQSRLKGSLSTSTKHSKEKAFRIKMMHNELPTLDNMAKRSPNLYLGHTSCMFCKEEEETLDHLVTCKDLENIRKEIWDTLANLTMNNWIPKHCNKDLNTSTEQTKQLLRKWYQSYFTTGKETIKICLGLISNSEIQKWKEALSEAGVPNSKAKFILSKFINKICRQLRKKIWNPRCDKFQQRKKEIGIPSLREIKSHIKKHPRSPSKKKSKNKDSKGKKVSNPPNNKSSVIIEDNEKQATKLKTSIWEWIKEKKKWLGI